MSSASCPEVKKIVLVDYMDPAAFRLYDPCSGSSEQFVCKNIASQTNELHPVGFYSERKIGLRRRLTISVYVYAEGPHIWLHLLGSVYDLCDASIRCFREANIPLLKRFSVWKKEEHAVAFSYWFADTETWPSNGDIFSFLDRCTRSEESRQGTLAALSRM